ncbi:hypothetical protein IE81DRAFT_341380 [Ceraceosorus guamensis]|uniref:Uncharacterized protein n=1 Tax=Ceraceosorus guamensis TaxID=1522189 RepID=A0A316VYB2_9BASI|nr:hypothetical protein IE81DRAFT_341380 [Ceraceosorus guamensis]PWN42480.1 hypothetical protein IE81DRAFT_341380 [Ceraceosorus guamensis]
MPSRPRPKSRLKTGDGEYGSPKPSTSTARSHDSSTGPRIRKRERDDEDDDQCPSIHNDATANVVEGSPSASNVAAEDLPIIEEPAGAQCAPHDPSHTEPEQAESSQALSYNAFGIMLGQHQQDFRGRMMQKLYLLGFPKPNVLLVPAYTEDQALKFDLPREQRPSVAIHAVVLLEHSYFRTILEARSFHDQASEAEDVRTTPRSLAKHWCASDE